MSRPDWLEALTKGDRLRLRPEHRHMAGRLENSRGQFRGFAKKGDAIMVQRDGYVTSEAWSPEFWEPDE